MRLCLIIEALEGYSGIPRNTGYTSENIESNLVIYGYKGSWILGILVLKCYMILGIHFHNPLDVIVINVLIELLCQAFMQFERLNRLSEHLHEID